MLYYIDGKKLTRLECFVPSTILKVWKNFVTEWKSEGMPTSYSIFEQIFGTAYPSVSISKLKEILLDGRRRKGHRMVLKKFKVITAEVERWTARVFLMTTVRITGILEFTSRPCLVMDKNNIKITEMFCLKASYLTKSRFQADPMGFEPPWVEIGGNKFFI
ncbi:hypothetical protein Ocin01_18705, partial [Orchesella cincta]